MTKKKTEFTEQQWVFTGRILSGSQVQYGWRPLDDDKLVDESETRYFSKLKSRVVGGVYTVQATESRAMTAPLMYRRQYEDEDLVAEWKALDVAVGIENDARLAAKRHTGNIAIDEALKPIIRAYSKTSARGRRALLVYITERIMRGRFER